MVVNVGSHFYFFIGENRALFYFQLDLDGVLM